jgi:hypothetical protein
MIRAGHSLYGLVYCLKPYALWRKEAKMGLVKFGIGITQISGSVGGDVFARNRSGNYIRPRTKPTNPNTARQVAVRAALSMLTERWSETLTVAQRTAWNLYASNVTVQNRLGEAIKLTGFNHYLRSKAWLARQGLTIIDAGPVVFTLPDTDPVMSITASEATQQATVVFDDGLDWASEDNAYMTFLTGQPQNPQRNFFKGPWQGTRYLSGNAGAPLASPLPIGWFQAITEGQHLWCQARIYRADGRVSNTFNADCICAA